MAIKIPDNYRIRKLMESGYDEQELPICPVCGEEAEYIYKDQLGFIIGCENCVERLNADDVDECFSQDEQ